MTTERFLERDAPSAKPFALVDALGRRDLAGALQAVHQQAGAGQEPLKLVGLVAWQVQRWLVVRRLMGLDWTFLPIVAVAVALGAMALTLAFGLAGTLAALRQRPLALLRNE